MGTTVEERRLRKSLTGPAARVLELLDAAEQEGYYAPTQLLAALHAGAPLRFIAFSCLGTIRGKEELRLDLFETYFLRSRKFGEMQRLLDRIREHIDASMTVILPDCEPTRTWGWQCNPHDSTVACELMIEDGRSQLPEYWEAVTWSSIEARSNGHITHASAVQWAMQVAQQVYVHQEDLHLRAFPDIEFAGGTRAAAERQVAAYAFEGAVLEQVHPAAIYVQSESPAARKDRMYQPMRKNMLPIIHPFKA